MTSFNNSSIIFVKFFKFINYGCIDIKQSDFQGYHLTNNTEIQKNPQNSISGTWKRVLS